MTTLRALTTIFTTILICCAVEIIFRPVDVLEHLMLATITDPATDELYRRVIETYGHRDIFVGVTIYGAAYLAYLWYYENCCCVALDQGCGRITSALVAWFGGTAVAATGPAPGQG